MKHTMNFTLDRETKGAIRFAECGDDGIVISESSKYIIGTLYIRKHALGGKVPGVLIVTIETTSGD